MALTPSIRGVSARRHAAKEKVEVYSSQSSTSISMFGASTPFYLTAPPTPTLFGGFAFHHRRSPFITDICTPSISLCSELHLGTLLLLAPVVSLQYLVGSLGYSCTISVCPCAISVLQISPYSLLMFDSSSSCHNTCPSQNRVPIFIPLLYFSSIIRIHSQIRLHVDSAAQNPFPRLAARLGSHSARLKSAWLSSARLAADDMACGTVHVYCSHGSGQLVFGSGQLIRVKKTRGARLRAWPATSPESDGECGHVRRPILTPFSPVALYRPPLHSAAAAAVNGGCHLLQQRLLVNVWWGIGGHPSIYAGNRSSIQDCSHWCLPGVPDTWNEFLHFHLLSKRGVTS
ncbi:hypothetical protein NC653_033222 [Populus alba x Populus x berolinensis]|uniref:Trichome birefringence-like C-terminal domain-containing protein n=1 Tax=Populus alba x Populus x berolinensis TaxID=444605 RepID=A0AAD6LTB9_9ROSI|nr:hypothetical protein NC653_033222 [Populus alba x Populus x berolinensis]